MTTYNTIHNYLRKSIQGISFVSLEKVMAKDKIFPVDEIHEPLYVVRYVFPCVYCHRVIKTVQVLISHTKYQHGRKEVCSATNLPYNLDMINRCEIRSLSEISSF